jgi:hypothetical protein
MCHAGLMDNFHGLENYLSKNARIIHNKNFENAVVKIQSLKESTLSQSEKQAISRYLIVDNEPEGERNADEEDEEEELNFAQNLLAEARASKRRIMLSRSKYRNLAHIEPTSNMVERLFSRAKLIMTDHRKSMSPRNLELLLYLICNRSLWNVLTIQELMDHPIE